MCQLYMVPLRTILFFPTIISRSEGGGYPPPKLFGDLAVFLALGPVLGGQVTLPDPNEPIKTFWGAQMTYF